MLFLLKWLYHTEKTVFCSIRLLLSPLSATWWKRGGAFHPRAVCLVTENAGRYYCALLKPMLSGTTVAGPTGNNSAWWMLSLVKAIFSLHTFLRHCHHEHMCVFIRRTKQEPATLAAPFEREAASPSRSRAALRSRRVQSQPHHANHGH